MLKSKLFIRSTIFCMLVVTHFCFLNNLFSQKSIKLDKESKVLAFSNDQKGLIFDYLNKYKCSYFLGVVNTSGLFFDIDSIAKELILKNKNNFELSCEGVIKKVIDSFQIINYVSFTTKKHFYTTELNAILKEHIGKFTFIFITAKNTPNFFKKKIRKWNDYIVRKGSNTNILVLEM